MKVILLGDDTLTMNFVEVYLLKKVDLTVQYITYKDLPSVLEFSKDYDVALICFKVNDLTLLRSFLLKYTIFVPVLLVGDFAEGKKFLKTGIFDVLYRVNLSSMLLMRSMEFAKERFDLESELKKQVKRTKELLKNQMQFLSNMSHEIRTPLTFLLGMSDWVKELSTNGQDVGMVEAFSRSCNHLAAVVGGVLDVAKIESQQMHLNIKPNNLYTVVMDIARMGLIGTAKKKLSFDYYIDPSLNAIYDFDKVRLTQCLFNLLNNAIKFTNTGGVFLVASYHEPQNTNVSPGADYIMFSVKDTGCGIKDKKSIFKLFFQENANLHREYDGSGIGLYIVQTIVKKMQGTVVINDNNGKGSEVKIVVPIKKIKDAPLDLDRGSKVQKIIFYNVRKLERRGISEAIKIFSDTPNLFSASLAKTKENLLEQVSNHSNLVFIAYSLPVLQLLSKNKTQDLSFDKWIFLINSPEEVASIEDHGFKSYLMRPVSVEQIKQLCLDQGAKHLKVKKKSVSTDSVQDVNKIKKLDFRAKKIKILLVEDNEDNRFLIKFFLLQKGYTVDEAVDGREAVSQAGDNCYDLILMDLHLPKLDGYQATVQIRKLEKSRSEQKPAIILALTANAFVENIDKAKRLNFSGYIVKPIQKDRFLAFLEESMSSSPFIVLE